jgi:hypothetical protein
VLAHQSAEGGKSIYALQTRLSALDYQVEPSVNCPDADSNDATFVRAAVMIGGHHAMGEFLVCEMYLLFASFGFREVSDGVTVML